MKLEPGPRNLRASGFTNLRAKVSFRAGTLTAVVDGDASGQALHLVLTADSNKVSFEANV